MGTLRIKNTLMAFLELYDDIILCLIPGAKFPFGSSMTASPFSPIAGSYWLLLLTGELKLADDVGIGAFPLMAVFAEEWEAFTARSVCPQLFTMKGC
jgi:hypothetical protein